MSIWKDEIDFMIAFAKEHNLARAISKKDITTEDGVELLLESYLLGRSEEDWDEGFLIGVQPPRKAISDYKKVVSKLKSAGFRLREKRTTERFDYEADEDAISYALKFEPEYRYRGISPTQEAISDVYEAVIDPKSGPGLEYVEKEGGELVVGLFFNDKEWEYDLRLWWRG